MCFNHHVGRQKTQTRLLEAPFKLMTYWHFGENLQPCTELRALYNVAQLVFLVNFFELEQVSRSQDIFD